MRPHPYVRAYMAGIAVPTVFLIVVVSVATFLVYSEASGQYLIGFPARPLERVIIFPMAVVPNLWGAWNMVHLALRSRVRVPLGLHGALLPLVLGPTGILLARAFGLFTIELPLAFALAPIGMAVYYLAWKYLVGSLNDELGIG